MFIFSSLIFFLQLPGVRYKHNFLVYKRETLKICWQIIIMILWGATYDIFIFFLALIVKMWDEYLINHSFRTVFEYITTPEILKFIDAKDRRALTILLLYGYICLQIAEITMMKTIKCRKVNSQNIVYCSCSLISNL